MATLAKLFDASLKASAKSFARLPATGSLTRAVARALAITSPRFPRAQAKEMSGAIVFHKIP